MTLREAAKSRDGGMCRICSSKDGLQVHHRNYKNKGKKDELKDLITLCAKCHGTYHGKVEAVAELPDSEVSDIFRFFKKRMGQWGEYLKCNFSHKDTEMIVLGEVVDMIGQFFPNRRFDVMFKTGEFYDEFGEKTNIIVPISEYE